MRMMRGFRQYVFNYPASQFPATLILLQHNLNLKTGFDVFLIFAVHR